MGVFNYLNNSLENQQGVDEEPDIRQWWRSSAENYSHVLGCEWVVAPEGMTTQLLPACKVDDSYSNITKPRCSATLLEGMSAGSNGTTRVRVIGSGFQKRWLAHNIIVHGQTLATFGALRKGLPSRVFLPNGLRGPLANTHKYFGTPVTAIQPSDDPGDTIIRHCKYVVERPVVFIFRMSGHSTFHMWDDNLGPFFDTLDKFWWIQSKADGGAKFGNKEDTRFSGELPLIIRFDTKPRSGPTSPKLLDENLQYFTTAPIMDAAEITEPVCFLTAMVGTSSHSFNNGALRRWMLSRIALRHRLMQMERSVSVASARQTSLRCLAPVGDSRLLPAAVQKWLAWRIRLWRLLPAQPNIVYLSRNHPKITRGRHTVNEADVLPALRDAVRRLTGKPLRLFFLEEMPPVDQAALMAETNILIAPHGGGIANCVWMPPGSVVVEFVAPAGKTLPFMYDKMCTRSDGAGPRRTHLPLVAEQDPAELDADFESSHPSWHKNKRLLSNIWMPVEKLISYTEWAIRIYNQSRLLL